MRLDTTTSSSDSTQTSVTDEISVGPTTACSAVGASSSANTTPQTDSSLPADDQSPEPSNTCSSGVMFVTDDHITIITDAVTSDLSLPLVRSPSDRHEPVTADPKQTGASCQGRNGARLKHDDMPVKPLIDLPSAATCGRRFSPLLTRRKSIDGTIGNQVTAAEATSNIISQAPFNAGRSRRIPAYRSMRNKTPAVSPSPQQQQATAAALKDKSGLSGSHTHQQVFIIDVKT